jgi:hypothetical protein
VALRSEVVDLVGLNFLDDPDQVRRVREVAVVQDHPPIRIVRVAVQVIDPVGVEQRRTAFHAVHLVALRQQQLREIRAVLARDPRDQRTLLVWMLHNGSRTVTLARRASARAKRVHGTASGGSALGSLLAVR